MHIGHYISLSIAIAVGITIGNFSSERASAAYHEYQLQEAKEQKRLKKSRERKINQQLLKEAIEDEKRMLSEKGQKLKITCDAWVKSFEETQSFRAKELMFEHCIKYQTYVREGVYN
ncbi:hypothetical protein [Aliamphritea ceti]|uniref:hypothetical protein n=1 Tax=Aliamphritea ceti TaxID=1524258 RepID=UPI0021C453F2|nr:hypothetical protein [Aliamphritea ceti]